MTKFTLADAVGNISERHIEKALIYRRRTNKLLWLAPAAACLILAICIVPIIKNRISTDPPDSDSTYSTDN